MTTDAGREWSERVARRLLFVSANRESSAWPLPAMRAVLASEVEPLLERIARWEREEISRASCCSNNEHAAKRWREIADKLAANLRDLKLEGYGDRRKAVLNEYDAAVKEAEHAG